MQLNAMAASRDKVGHEQWTSAIINTMFMGCMDPCNKAQFKCLQEGFTTPLASTGLTVTEVVQISSPRHALML